MKGNKIHELFSRPERPYRSMLSVYLDVDQSRPSNRNRGFETQLKNLLATIRPTLHGAAELERFSLAAHRITDFVSEYDPQARGLGLFFDESDGFFRDVDFDVPVQLEARWDREFYLQPLAAALEHFQTYGVAMLDRRNLRLFTVFLGHIEEHVREGLGSESVGLNLKHVVKMIDWLVESRHLNRLILAGGCEITAELRDLLPKRLNLRVIGEVDIEMDASAADVLDLAMKIAEAYERDAEAQKVNEVLTAALKSERAAAGLGRTLKAVNSDKVWELIYSENFKAPGFECANCGGLFSTAKAFCQYCGGKVQGVTDVVERAIEQALRNGAKVQVAAGDAATMLAAGGGIAAFLRHGRMLFGSDANRKIGG
jgi:peptide chain release factor subunit 1